jgi:hypothetical protein
VLLPQIHNLVEQPCVLPPYLSSRRPSFLFVLVHFLFGLWLDGWWFRRLFGGHALRGDGDILLRLGLAGLLIGSKKHAQGLGHMGRLLRPLG